jgi:hypothetical protein
MKKIFVGSVLLVLLLFVSIFPIFLPSAKIQFMRPTKSYYSLLTILLPKTRYTLPILTLEHYYY